MVQYILSGVSGTEIYTHVHIMSLICSLILNYPLVSIMNDMFLGYNSDLTTLLVAGICWHRHGHLLCKV